LLFEKRARARKTPATEKGDRENRKAARPHVLDVVCNVVHVAAVVCCGNFVTVAPAVCIVTLESVAAGRAHAELRQRKRGRSVSSILNNYTALLCT